MPVLNLNNILKNIVVFFFISAGALFYNCAFGQRTVDLTKFSAAYYDSIRAMVYDTTNINYRIKAYRLSNNEKIDIDGKLNEPAWQKAQHRSGFLEKEPYPLVPMSEKTEFAILYDNENLYIGVWCWDSQPDKIIKRLSPRGTYGPDNITMFLDSYNDKRTGYKFGVSPTGVQIDELRYDDVKRDNNWNGIWYSEGSVDDKGWYAEVKIPFFNLRYSGNKQQTWGFNIMRSISRNASRGQWKPHLPEWDNTTRMSQLGIITGINNISSGRTFEIRPYATVSSNNTMNTDTYRGLNFGGDIRYSPSPNITADFTFNPDFAQVDADVFEINLTRYPTRFKELRPFFTERKNVFNTPIELFYSRRIGARSDIIGGAKGTGKLNDGFEFGAIGTVTGKSVFSNIRLNAEKAIYGVTRVKKDILGSSSIGILAATKEQPGKDNYNRVLGADGNFLLNDNNIVNFQIATGQTEMNYSQNMAYILSYILTGDLWGAKFNTERIEPAFEINRIGYIKKEPDRGWNRGTGILRYSPRINKHNIRRITVNFEAELSKDLFTDRYIDRWMQTTPALINNKPGNATNNSDKQAIISNITETNNYKTGGNLKLELMNEMTVSVEYKHYTATELTGNYKGNLIDLKYMTRPIFKGAQVAGIFSATGGTYYNFKQRYVGSHTSIAIDGEGRLGHNFLTKLQGGYTKTYNPDNKNDGIYYKISSNSTLMFTKDFYVRLHAQGIFGTTFYNTEETYNEYLLSLLLSWEYRPGSFLYLAYNESRYDKINSSVADYMNLLNRTLIFKVSYFFSL